MNPIQDIIRNLQELATQLPEILQPFIIMLAGAVPFVEGEGAAVIGIVAGMNPVVAASPRPSATSSAWHSSCSSRRELARRS